MRVVSIVKDDPALGLGSGAEACGRTGAVAAGGGGNTASCCVSEAGGGGGGSSTSWVGAREEGAGGRGTSRCDAR